MKTNMNMMKSILMVLVVGALVCSSCDDGSPKETFDDETPPCNCLSTYGSTAHLAIDEACKCGGTECHCTEQFAYLDDNNTIKIRKEKGVNVVDMNSAVTKIKTTYAGFNPSDFNGKITAIHITITGKLVRYDTNNIIWINLDEVKSDNNFDGLLNGIKNGHITTGFETDE